MALATITIIVILPSHNVLKQRVRHRFQPQANRMHPSDPTARSTLKAVPIRAFSCPNYSTRQALDCVKGEITMPVKHVLSAFVAVLFCGGIYSTAATFQEVPPPIGAYTLPGGDLYLGAGVTIAGFSSLAAILSADYGVTNTLQIGGGLSFSLASASAYSAKAKLRFPLGGSVDMAFAISASLQEMGMGLEFGYVQGGVTLSAKVLSNLTIHAGVTLTYTKIGLAPGPWFFADLDLLPNLKVLVYPLGLGLSVWFRMVPTLDLSLSVWPFAPLGQISVYLRL